MEATLRLRVLGPVSVEGVSVVDGLRPAHRRLLSILAIEPGAAISVDELIDRFWPDRQPTTAKSTIHTHVSAIRRALGAAVIGTEGGRYRLDPEAVSVDVVEFTHLASTARDAANSGAWHEALSACDSALGLLRGSPFPDLIDDEFARPAIVRINEVGLDLFETRAQSLLELDRPADALVELEGLVLEHPLRERLWEWLMLARYRLGRYAEALRAYRELSSHLAEVGLEPGDSVRRLEGRILLRDATLIPTRHNLPSPLDDFIGRDREIESLGGMIGTRRIVTVTGAGGSGKTRLAVRVGSELLDSFDNGVWFVELAPISDASLVAEEIARAIGVTLRGTDAVDAILTAIGDRPTLIVLDNCEHVLQGAARVVERLISGSDRLVVLATSREPLRIGGEALFELAGLTVPAPGAGADEASRSDSIRLLMRRAELVDPTFDLANHDLDAAVSVCRRLDGLPLALELVAARARTMSLTAVEARLGDQLALLTTGASTGPARHRTLESAIDWSYQLLSELEQTALRRLAVFQGGFDLEAAEYVVTDAELPSSSVAQLVADLVDKSLVSVLRTGAGVRYRLLETVRQFALARLDEAGDADQTRSRHRAWCSSLVQDVWQQALGPGQAALIRTLRDAGDNLRAALAWEFEHPSAPSTRTGLQTALAWRAYFEGHLGVAVADLGSALDAVDDEGERALLDALMACCLFYSERVDEAIACADRALRAIDAVDSSLARAWIIDTVKLGHLMSATADPAQMLVLAAEAAEIVASSDDTYARMMAEQAMADAACWNGDTAIGLRHQRAALAHARRTGDALAIDRISGASIYNFMLDPVARRSEPLQVVRDWRSHASLRDDSWRSTATDWLPWVYLQAGDFEQADEACDRIGTRTLDGYNRTIHLIVRATIDWMRGNLRDARAAAESLDAHGVNTRWPHVYYPLVAEIAADQGRMDDLRHVVDVHRSLPVHTSKEATKLGSLGPLVRAAVDAAIESGSVEFVAQAEAAVDEMRRIVDEHPPPLDSWTSIMTHRQNLVVAEAELTRITGSDTSAWERAAEIVDYAYYEHYARWRVLESRLLAGDRSAEGELRQLHSATASLGMQLLVTRIQRTALVLGVDLGGASRRDGPSELA